MTWLDAGVIVVVALIVDGMVSTVCRTWLAAKFNNRK